MRDVSFSDIDFFVDSQVVLSWILTCKVPKKNIFVNNRLKEINSMLIKSSLNLLKLILLMSPHNLILQTW